MIIAECVQDTECYVLTAGVLQATIMRSRYTRAGRAGCVPRSVEKERRPPLRHQSIRSGGNLRVFENLAQTLVAVDAS